VKEATAIHLEGADVMVWVILPDYSIFLFLFFIRRFTVTEQSRATKIN